MIRALHFEIELLEDAVLPAPAGRGAHGGSGLDFVPGSALLGVAARFYDELDPALQWTVFHSGRIRFGDARPVEPGSGAPAAPAPLSLHAPKGERVEALPCDDLVDGTQGEPRGAPLKKLVVGPGGRPVGVARRVTLRTAVDFGQGRAREGQLFSYDAIAAGTRLRFSVEIDGTSDGAIDESVADLVRRAFAGCQRVGRSRGAEHGLARFTLLGEGDPPWAPWPLAEGPAEDRLSLWCQSELALLDPVTGAPTLRPRRAHFPGLPEGAVLDPSRCFVRAARWSTYNAHRRRPDVETIAIKAGSVITFRGIPKGFSLGPLREAARRGFGCHREQGLGQVVVHPRLFVDLEGAWIELPPLGQPAREAAPPDPPGDELGRWLRPRVDRMRADQAAWERAEEAFEDRFRRWARRPSGPTRAQWNAVRGLARTHVAGALEGTTSRLLGELEALCMSGVGKRRWQHLFEHLRGFVAERSDTEAPLALGYLADRVVKARHTKDQTETLGGGS